MTTVNRKNIVRDGIDLAGLTAGPSQVWGTIRLVPLLRATPITDLRLHPRLFDPEDLSVVRVDSRSNYVAFIPHAFVASWTDDGTPAAAFGTQLAAPNATAKPDRISLRFHRRMARREDNQRLRFLPLHLALEGFLDLHFGGPSTAWQEWTFEAVTRGLTPRIETAYAGAWLSGLDDALRVFEIHPDQCGVMLYVADALAAAFVVPHPDDYRLLHPTLLRDLYGELLYHYARVHPDVSEFTARLDDDGVTTIGDLRAQLGRVQSEWVQLHDLMAAGVFGSRPLAVSPVHRMARFTLSRFLPVFDPEVDNHLGETITTDTGELAYLKTFRLSAAQTRRGHLLSQLAAHDWHLDATATALGTDRHGLVTRMDHAGFGYLLRPDIIDACRNRNRRRTR